MFAEKGAKEIEKRKTAPGKTCTKPTIMKEEL